MDSVAFIVLVIGALLRWLLHGQFNACALVKSSLWAPQSLIFFKLLMRYRSATRTLIKFINLRLLGPNCR